MRTDTELAPEPISGVLDPVFYAEPEPIPLVLINQPVYGLLLPNGTLYRELEARQADPGGIQPTVWVDRGQADVERAVVAGTLEIVYGSTEADAVRVVRVEKDAEGIWAVPMPEPSYRSYRPISPYTGRPSPWPCRSIDDLTVPEAREVMRGHLECAGPLPCRIRGRARAVLARAGVMALPSAERAARLWKSLDLPVDRAR